ncbi:MAG: type IV pilus twitching motility protein PilT [Candidatus Eisenbacteria bacterium]|uniref:Type IV pilus twitching motility protein PilT n=1 Tax=Eiseniibacteriota bacterium TaxID=2212470 RepID=A0A937X7W8_UNCEI|nr:type IV pilus twitching motility protein PilT [Candidatus Eisenbacteria bacterium]
MISLERLLAEMAEKGASDLHLTAGVPPQLRIDGRLVPTEHEVLDPDACARLVYSILREEQKKRFEQEHELDLSFGIRGLARFRANVFMQRGSTTAAIRLIPHDVMSFDRLGLPPVVAEFAEQVNGLVLVTGPTGSGKSTTLAALIDRINRSRPCHIMTIEDPIEYVHANRRAIVNQREIGADTRSFPTALKYVLRQDPDVILIGEMRDLETISAALTIAETGHLVFATLHTNSTYEAINRIVDVFPTNQQKQVLAQIAFVLRGVLTQQLIPHRRGRGRVMVAEVLACTPAIAALVREGKVHQIYTMMQAGQKHGMQTMNQGLFQAYVNGAIRLDEILARSGNPAELEAMLAKADPTYRPRVPGADGRGQNRRAA